MIKSKTVAESRLETAQVMTPNEANFLGKVFGGALLSLIDLHAYATASHFAETVCVTASVDRVNFHKPINVADLVRMTGFVNFVGRTSLEVTINVTSKNLLTGSIDHTNTARLTMVAIKDGKPIEVPRLICETREEKIQFLEGKLRRELRLSEENDFFRIAETFHLASDKKLDDLLGKESLS